MGAHARPASRPPEPHFTHEFREFAGCTPRDYLRLRTPDGESVVSA